jgi:hypothetical protein
MMRLVKRKRELLEGHISLVPCIAHIQRTWAFLASVVAAHRAPDARTRQKDWFDQSRSTHATFRQPSVSDDHFLTVFSLEIN